LPQRVIQEGVALRLKSKIGQEGDRAIEVLQVLEQPDEQERINAIREQIEAEAQQQAGSRFEMLEFGLKQKIAHLEAQLAKFKPSELVSSPIATGLQDVLAPKTTLESTASTGLYSGPTPEPADEIGLQRFSNEVALAPDQASEYNYEPTEASNDYLEPISSDAGLQRKENVAQNLGAEGNGVFQSGDLVQIDAASDRTWNGLRGYIQKVVTKTCKAVVLLQGDYRSKHFFLDELKLVHEVEEDFSDAIQARAPQKELVEAYATNAIPQSSSAEPVSDGSTTTVTDDAVAPESVEPASQPEAASSASTISNQPLAADWDLIQELRAAESSLQKIDAKIQGLNSPLAKSCSNTVVERELKQLRSLHVSEIVNLINSNLIPAYYEELQGIGRVVLDPKYASDFLMQAQSWADVVLVVGSDGKQLVNAVKEWSKESKQLLVQLLSEYLETEPSAFNQIDWLPKKLLGRALSSLSFTVQRIKKSDNLVDEPEIEYISGCQFNSLSNLGTRHEQWVFHFEGNLIPAFGRDEFLVEKF